jgi:hypothetical protein
LTITLPRDGRGLLAGLLAACPLLVAPATPPTPPDAGAAEGADPAEGGAEAGGEESGGGESLSPWGGGQFGGGQFGVVVGCSGKCGGRG